MYDKIGGQCSSRGCQFQIPNQSYMNEQIYQLWRVLIQIGRLVAGKAKGLDIWHGEMASSALETTNDVVMMASFVSIPGGPIRGQHIFPDTKFFLLGFVFFFSLNISFYMYLLFFLQFSQKRGNCFNCYLKTIHGLYLFMQLKRVKCSSIIQSSSASFSAFILCWEMIVWKINNSVQHNIVTN